MNSLLLLQTSCNILTCTSEVHDYPNENIAYPTITIETVELVYYTSDPRYPKSDSNIDPIYIQPAWRFHGHYSNGDDFEFLVQALKEEYLLPEVLPHVPPG